MLKSEVCSLVSFAYLPLRDTYIYAMTVVSDLEKLETAIFHQDLDRGGTSVDSILYQLLQSVHRSDDDLSSGDLVHHIGIQCLLRDSAMSESFSDRQDVTTNPDPPWCFWQTSFICGPLGSTRLGLDNIHLISHDLKRDILLFLMLVQDSSTFRSSCSRCIASNAAPG